MSFSEYSKYTCMLFKCYRIQNKEQDESTENTERPKINFTRVKVENLDLDKPWNYNTNRNNM